ncbi:MAG: GNAT family N-acetyltransferase [Pseudonocardiales bacterium]|nr:GNAT family N-acetyltransferase [Actinomycetota bacterium]PZS16804.1 MAG: GNAT family N-acetyltransferase [Pseudonocardiales bacterium]
MLTVRDAQPRDAAEVAGVHVRSWQAAYRGLFPDDYLDGLQVEDRMARYTFGDTRPDRPATIVAVADATICGFATTGPCRDDDVADAGELYTIYVDPPVWGRGIGRSLITEARARLCRQGSVEAIVWVLAGNEQAQRFYRADGWRPDGHRRQEDVWGVLADEIRYRRTLP